MTTSTMTSHTIRRSVAWREWFWKVTIAEFAGFGIPALVGALTVDSPPTSAFTLLVAAGSVEGLVLGLVQGAVLSHLVADFPRRSWTIATGVGAACAWAVALLPMLLYRQLTDGSAVTQVLAVGVVALVAVFSIGSAQWIVLRHVSPRAGQWILGSSIGWCAGLLAFGATTTPLWNEGQTTFIVVVIGVLGGLVMAAVMAAVTGSFMTQIVGSLDARISDHRPSTDNPSRS